MNMTMRIPNLHSLICVFLLSTMNIAADADQPINYTRDIRPIISSNCVQCHGPDQEKLEADLRLDREAGIAQAFRDGGEGIERITSETG
jgi:mono/diheme cytochrome c family protein